MYICPITKCFWNTLISLCSSKTVDEKEILHTVSNTSIYCSSDKVGTVSNINTLQLVWGHDMLLIWVYLDIPLCQVITWNSSANHRSGQKGDPVPGGITGHPVTEGHKYRHLVLQVGVLIQGWWPCSVKKLLLQNPKLWKPDGLLHDEIDKSGRLF
jgi:hypothetical protein